jgi:16S rRNA C1402 (ribose-2'-O) methylase RsmI
VSNTTDRPKRKAKADLARWRVRVVVCDSKGVTLVDTHITDTKGKRLVFPVRPRFMRVALVSDAGRPVVCMVLGA